MRARRIVGLGALVCALALVAGAGGTTTPLPGGTSLDVTITSPSNGAVLPLGPVTVTGTAAVGTGAPVANTTLIYIVDVSGSTSEATGVPGKCPQQNVYDLLQDTTLDCELLAIRDLNAAAIATGTVAKVGMIAFAGTGTDTLSPLNITSAAALDVSPLSSVTTLTPPGANDATPPPGVTTVFTPQTNLDWVVQSAYINTAATTPGLVGWPTRGPSDGFTEFAPHDIGQSTNYTAALYALRTLLGSVTTPNTVVAFLSDGLPTVTVAGQQMGIVLGTLPTAHLTIDTFAVGASASCGTASPTLNGSLEQIAVHFGKHCQVLHDASDAVDLVPDVVASKLSSVTLADGSTSFGAVTSSPAVPQNGPATVSWTKTLTGLAPGPHHVCATATGSDGGGTGTTSDCVDFTIKAPPTVTVGDGSGNAGTTDEGTAFPISATASDGTTTWAISTGPCAFADAGSPSTTVTCFDNGTYTLLFRASDGVNPPVFGSETLTVNNVSPTPTLTLSPGPHAVGSPVTADVSIVDPGTLDTETCSIDWGDGTTDTLFVGTLRECTAPHTYATAGSFTVTVTVADKDGGTGSDSKTLVVNGPPVVHVSDASGSEGSAIPLTGTATDPEGDPLTYAWTATPLSGVAAGAGCTFSNPAALSPTITCNDNGTWTITLTASDGVNAPVSSSGTLTVLNVAPHATLTFSAGPHAVGSTVTANVSIADPGAIDTFGCTFDWADGSTSTVLATGSSCTASHAYAASGSYHVTVTVVDKDGGTGLDTQNVVVDGPPVVHVSDASGNEGSAIPLTATATDPEGDPLTYAWTATPLSGVAAGAGCTFSNPAALSPTITCNDNGTWTITLTASDGVNAPVSSSGTLTVLNVAPHATLTFSAGPHAVGSTVTANVSIADPGAIDTFGCTFDWGDGSTSTVLATGSSCTAPHAYAASGSYHVTVTVVDKDGGTGLDTQIVVVDGPPVVHVSNASGSEGSAIPLTATATDPEGDPLTYAWTATPGAGVDAGAACTFSNPAALAPSVTCTDDGTWTLTLVASDGINPGVTATGTLTVANVAPTVTITSPAAGTSSRSVSFSANVADPGSNDVLSCSINWGDGTAVQVVAVAGGVCATTHTYATSVTSATITVTASDDDGGTATATRALSFNRPPICSAVKAVPDELWPPDGELKLVTLVGASDPDGGPVTYTITGVTQNEQLGGWDGHDNAWYEKGRHNRPPDAVILHGPYLLLRAWRDPHGDGRVYTIAFTVTDGQGATCSGTTTVEVPHDRGHHPRHDKHDDDYDSFGRR